MAFRTKILALAAGVSAAALGAQTAATWTARHEVDRLAARLEATGASVTRGTVSADLLGGRVRLSGFGIRDASGLAVRIGSVAVPVSAGLVSSALAADDVTLSDVTVEFAGQTYLIKTLTVSGTANSKDEIAALFDKAATTPLSERLKKISARSVSAPDIVMKQTQGEVTSSIVYKDARLDGLSNGIAATFSAASGALASQGGSDEVAVTFGPVGINTIDFVQIARVYNETAAPGETELKPVYGSFSVDGLKGTAGKGGTFAVARMAGKDFRMKPGKEPWLATMKEMAAERDPGKLPPERRAKLMSALADMFDSFSVGSMEATGISGGDGSKPEAPEMKIARIAVEGAAMGKPNAFHVEGTEVTTRDGHVRIGDITHSGWSYATTIAALRDQLGKPDVDMQNLPVRKFLPHLGTLTIRGVDIDAPDVTAREKNPSAPNVKAGLQLFEIAAGNEYEGVPTSLRLSLDRLTMALPADSPESGIRDLLAMGYKDLDLSAGFDARWDQASGDVTVNSLGVQGVNMGSVAVRGTLGNVSPDVFAGDAASAQVALLGATVKGLSVAVDNKGLFEKALEREARKQGKSADKMRKELGAIAQLAIPGMLGGSAQAKQVGAAVAKFILKPNRLTVDAKSRDPGGLGMVDFMQAQSDPLALLAAIDLAAKAE